MKERLFSARVPGRLLKNLFTSAQHISPQVTLSLGQGDADPLRLWCRDAREQCAMHVSTARAVFDEVEASAAIKVVASSKVLVDVAGLFDAKRPVSVGLVEGYEDGGAPYSLVFGQGPVDDQDVRTLGVMEADVLDVPYRPGHDVAAWAAVDLTMFDRSMKSFKKASDVVTVSVGRDGFRLGVDTRKVRDGWSHPCETVGRARMAFSVHLLHAAVKGAKALGQDCVVSLTPEKPLEILVEGDGFTADFHVAHSQAM